MQPLFVALLTLFTSTLTYGQGHTSTSNVTSIEQVDFLNFTFPLSDDCMQKTVSLKMGKFQNKEIRVQLTQRFIIYADLTHDGINEAIVPVACDFYGNYFVTDALVYSLRNGSSPFLIGKITESMTDSDYKKQYPDGFMFGTRQVQADNGKVIIHRLADGSHACPENDARFEYIWNGKTFVLSGKPMKRPIKNCGAESGK